MAVNDRGRRMVVRSGSIGLPWPGLSTTLTRRNLLILLLIPALLIAPTAPPAGPVSAQAARPADLLPLAVRGQPGPAGPARGPVLPWRAAALPARDSSAILSPRTEATTTLQLAILSSPWAVLDHNDPGGSSKEVPKVFVVEAVVTNTGAISATDVFITLDYDPDPANNWVLLPGEDPERTVDELAPGAAYHAYWFARYSLAIGASHRYTMTASADNADPVTTWHNYYGDPVPGRTVQTRPYISTGSSGVVQTSANVVVGVAFAVTVTYDLGNNPLGTIFSPVGNIDFDSAAYRMLASKVRFYNDAQTQEKTVYDRLYFPSLPGFADNAEAVYTFIALTPANTRLCPYCGVDYQSNDKYDRFYCSPDRGTIIPITGTVGISLTKLASTAVVQQNQVLTYTLRYTNNGAMPISFAWIWDDIDTALASIITASVDPPGDPDESTASRVAWYVGMVAPGAGGTLTLAVLVDGSGQDIPDGTALVNRAYLGINEGSLPHDAAITQTITTTVQAPTIALVKTDGRANVQPGEVLTYTLRFTNSGSITATAVVITDVLPADVHYLSGTAIPPESIRAGQTLVWTGLPPIPPQGGTFSIQVPVTVDMKVPNGTALVNTAATRYENTAGHLYAAGAATDTTTVQAPVLSIGKSDFPDPVLTGHLITYTLSHANGGPAAASGVVITDVVPLSTTYQSCSGAMSCTMTNGVVRWTLGTVPGGSSGSVRFSVRVSDSLPTGTFIRNQDYGIVADQSDWIPGPPITTRVNRNAGFIDGHAFVDANANGVFDPGEGTLPGVTVTLPAATVPLTQTDSGGYYRFRIETEGALSVSAALPPGYFRTTPGTAYFNGQLEVTQTVNFGYAPLGSSFGVIYGTVFADGDHDGQQDPGEPGLANVTISSAQAMTPSVTTNGWGQYTLRFNAAGTATIVETDPPFYVSTTPNTVTVNVTLGSSGDSPVDFGDFRGIKITGMVFDDVNVNGVHDPTEGGLPGAIVAADGDSYATASSGAYTLYVTIELSSPIPIGETDPTGYVSTDAVPGAGMSRVDPNTLRIDSPVSGTVYTGGDFGDVLAGSVVTISGHVWEDNGAGGGGPADGQRDPGEPGLSGAVIRLSSGLTQTTAAGGGFSLCAPAGQVITVSEVNPPGYASTNAIPGNDAYKVDNDTVVIRALAGGSTSADNLFGDILLGSAAVLTGTVFDDANENGVPDGGEWGLPRITVTLEISGGPSIAVRTDAAGHYQFAVAPGTDVRVVSTGPGGGFYPTTPESLQMRPPQPGVYPDNNFGYSDDADVAMILGIVFDDVNGNGRQDWGEAGLAEAVLTLDGSDPITTSGNGLITGTFGYSVTQLAVYALHEANPPGYRSTTPDDVNVDVSALGQSYFVQFGDTDSVTAATVYGTVFDDRNSDGRQDTAEVGLPGVRISLTAALGLLTTTTDLYGRYTFGLEAAAEGYCRVREQEPALPGYHSTTPDRVVLYVVPGGSYVVDFGDTNAADSSTIMGTVFDDISGDGLQDPAEPGIPGVTVALSTGSVTTTDGLGQYTFALTATGVVQVTETDPPGYHSTTPNTVTLEVLALGQAYEVNFGDSDDATTSSFYGTVFDDRNANGARDTNEPGLPGVTVALTDTMGGSVSLTTNRWGQYTFLLEYTGTYTVSESDLPGYLSTAAIPGDPAVVVIDENTLRATLSTLGWDLGDNMFGDIGASEVVTISGYAWNDNGAGGGTAGDGLWNGTEPGLPGAVISLSSGMTQSTGADGSFQLLAPPNQAITVSEVNPPGYVSTDAIPGNDATRVDEDTLVVSPLPGGSTSAGNLFGDVVPADLAVAKSDDPDPVQAGTTLTYTLVYSNSGPAAAQEVYLTDTLPAEVTFGGVVREEPPLPGFSFSGRNLTWYTPTLAAGASGTIVFTVTVNPDVLSGTILINEALILADTPDTLPDDNSDSESTLVGAAADLAVAKSDDPDPVRAGATLTYTLVYSNSGPAAAQEVYLTDTLPAEVTFGGVVREEPPLPGFSFSGRNLTWYTPTLAAGASGTIVFTVTVEVSASGAISNAVRITGALPDPHPEDNAAQERTAIVALAIISGTVFEDGDMDGLRDPGEPGIGGVPISLDGLITATADLSGSYSFSTTVMGLHTVVETDPAGYVSTTPNTVTVIAAPGGHYQVDFGDVRTAGCTCPPDGYEEDDVALQAGELPTAQVQAHDFCDDATDWVTFTAEAGDVYTLTTSSWGQRADTFLALYDRDARTLLAANDDCTGTVDYSSCIVWQAPSSGVYYVRTTNRAGLSGCATGYDLSVERRDFFFLYLPLTMRGHAAAWGDTGGQIAPTGVISHTCPDAYEVDDTWQQASAIAAGVVQTHSFDSDPLQYAADKDFVWFDVRPNETLTFTTAPLTDTQTLLELYDAHGVALGLTGTTSLVWKPAHSGRYYLSVSPIAPASYGCPHEVGYSLLMERRVYTIYLPVILRSS